MCHIYLNSSLTLGSWLSNQSMSSSLNLGVYALSRYLTKRPFLSRTTNSRLFSLNCGAGTLKVKRSSQTGCRLSFTNSVFRLRLLSGSKTILTNGSGRCEAGLAEIGGDRGGNNWLHFSHCWSEVKTRDTHFLILCLWNKDE